MMIGHADSCLRNFLFAFAVYLCCRSIEFMIYWKRKFLIGLCGRYARHLSLMYVHYIPSTPLRNLREFIKEWKNLPTFHLEICTRITEKWRPQELMRKKFCWFKYTTTEMPETKTAPQTWKHRPKEICSGLGLFS